MFIYNYVSLSNRCYGLFVWFIWISNLVPVMAKQRYKPLSKDLIQYEEGKRLYKAQAYKEAKVLLDTLRKEVEDISLAPYIHFYYALAAYHNGEVSLASQTFAEIYLHFPSWRKRNEACYWSAQCKFQEGYFEEALMQLVAIQDREMAKPVAQMKKYFLKQVDNLTYLQGLVEKFPEDALLKKIVYKQAACQAYITQDYTLVQKLKEQYHLEMYHYDPLRGLPSQRKKAYKVAVFLPFLVDELDYGICTSQFVIELYQGIQLAVTLLAKEGIVLQLFAFDTKKDAATTKALLMQEALQHMDLIIGPLYPTTIPLVAAFAKKYKINFINPISTNSAIVAGNPFAFLFQTSLESCAQKATQLTLDAIQPVATPCIAVFYTEKEVVQATLYKQLVEQRLGRPVDLFLQLPENDIKHFFKKLHKSQQSENKEMYTTANGEVIDDTFLKNITHVYLPSQHKLLVSSVINCFLQLGTKPQIIGHEEWIKDEVITPYLGKLPILFLAPHYIDFIKPNVRQFQNAFLEQTASPPTLYSYIGYELMVFFGQMLFKYGTYFQKEWKEEAYDGMIFQKIYYGPHHCNQHIPILAFHKGKFVVQGK